MITLHPCLSNLGVNLHLLEPLVIHLMICRIQNSVQKSCQGRDVMSMPRDKYVVENHALQSAMFACICSLSRINYLYSAWSSFGRGNWHGRSQSGHLQASVAGRPDDICWEQPKGWKFWISDCGTEIRSWFPSIGDCLSWSEWMTTCVNLLVRCSCSASASTAIDLCTRLVDLCCNLLDAVMRDNILSITIQFSWFRVDAWTHSEVGHASSEYVDNAIQPCLVPFAYVRLQCLWWHSAMTKLNVLNLPRLLSCMRSLLETCIKN